MLSTIRPIFILTFFCVHLAAVGQECENLEVSIQNDTTLCSPGCVDLNGQVTGDYLFFRWSDPTGYINYFDLNPCIDVSGPNLFTLEVAQLNSTNLIDNGHFEGGNASFTSDYGYVDLSSAGCPLPVILCDGNYSVTDNPNPLNPSFIDCDDVTLGPGNMAVFNGASSPQNIWCQNITVNPNKPHIISSFATSFGFPFPRLQYTIDGTPIGNEFTVFTTGCNWFPLNLEWNSGANTNVEICIQNNEVSSSGNDFALDDIGFYELCIDSKSFSVDIGSPSVFIDESQTLINCTNPEIELSSIVLPITSTVDYEWSTQDGTIISSIDESNIIIGDGGEYMISVIDENGCSDVTFISIDVDTIKPMIAPLNFDTLTCTLDSTMLSIEAINNVSYSWYNSLGQISNQTSNSIEVDTSDLFYILVTGTNGCIDSFAFDVKENKQNPNIDLIGIDTLTCLDTQLILTVVSDSMITGYYWNTGDSLSQQIITESGVYEVTITSNNGCQANESFEIFKDQDKPSISIINDSLLTCLVDSIEVMTNVDSSIADIQWSQTDTQINTVIYNPGEYFVTVTGLNGCTQIDSITILEDKTKPNINIEGVQILTCLDTSITVVASSTFENVVFDWNGGNINDSISINNPGLYTLVATAPNGCKRDSFIEINQQTDAPGIISMSNGDLNCKEKETKIWVESDTPNAQYLWNNLVEDSVFIANQQGQYTVQVISPEGCISFDTVIINYDSIYIDIMLENGMLNCFTPQYDYNPLESINYDSVYWTLPDMTISELATVEISNAGSYYVSFLDSLGCIHNDSLEITIDTISPTFTYSVDTIRCNNDGEIQLFDVDQYEIEWIVGDISISEQSSFETDTAVNVQLQLTGINGCITVDTISIPNLSTTPMYSIQTNDITCKNTSGSIEIEGDNALMIDWEGDDFMIIDSLSMTTSSPGNYYITVTDDHLCTSFDTLSISIDTIAPMLVYNFNNITCMEPNATLEIALIDPSVSYYWINGIDTILNTQIVTMDPGTYTALVQNEANGCITSEEIIVEIDTTSPEIQLNASSFNCFNDSAFISLMTQNENVQIDWFHQNTWINDSKDSIIVGLPGIYTVNAVDTLNGCTSDQNIQIDTYIPLSFEFSIVQPTCIDTLGQISILSIEGGIGDYKWSLDGGITIEPNNIVQSLLPGVYSIWISDAEECVIIQEVEIFEVEGLNLSILEELFISPNEQIEVNPVINGNEILNIEWFPSDILSCSDCWNPSYLFNQDTILTITITDINGCMDSAIVNIFIEEEEEEEADQDIFIPNIFSPSNGENGNQTFNLFTSASNNVTIDYLSIYDRWGNLVFHQKDYLSNDPSLGWDGKYNGQDANQGVYVYSCKITFMDGSEKIFIGDILLVK